jgi:DNA ligase 1
MLLADLARTSAAVAAVRARSAKVALLADCLRRAEAGEVALAASYLAGELRQRRTGLGYAAVRERPPVAAEPSLTVAETDAVFERLSAVSGPGAGGERRALFGRLLARATADEQRLIVGLVAGDLRQGALEGIMTEAVAKASAVSLADVRRAVMLRGALPAVAEAVLVEGRVGLARFRLEVGRPVQPMLAQSADGITTALERVRPAAVEWKLDGIRIQVHRAGRDVAVFTRTLDDVTARVPEVVEAALTLPVDAVVLDGEAIALGPDARPRPFQVTAARTGSQLDVARARAVTPLVPLFFDVVHLDGTDLLDLPSAHRHAALATVLPAELRMPRRVTADVDEARAVLDDALARGHEGVVVKSLDAPYEAGRRGSGWLKVKPRHTLDLVVLAAEWGSGRRRGWLSNLHLGARDADVGGFVMLGKTFKGLTDAMLRWQTDRLLALEVGRDDWTVYVRPELVVEVAFDGVQSSSRYPGGVALRFARVLRHRPDKPAAQADTIAAVRVLHAGAPGPA